MWIFSENVVPCFRFRRGFSAVWLIFVVLLLPASADDASSDIARLRKDLLPANNQAMKMVRPVVLENSSITLLVTVNMSNFVSFELDKSEAVTELSVCFSWYAETLTWEPAKYNGLNNLTVSSYEVWLPDVEVYNNVDFTQEISLYAYRVQLSSDGVVEWCPRIQATVSCDTDMSHFPHDEHGCVLLIGSATYSYEQVRLEPRLVAHDESPNSVGIRSSNWDLTFVTFQLVKGKTGQDYYDYALHLAIFVKRRFSLHLYSFTLPLFICAVLTLTFCWLPLDDQKRFHVGLLSVILNIYLIIRYSDTLRHSVSVPWGLRFSGDLVLFTCCMIVLQILWLALEEMLVPFAMHPILDRFLSTKLVNTYVLNDNIILINEDECDTNEGDNDGKPKEDPQQEESAGVASHMEAFRSPAVAHPTKTANVNRNWRNLLIAVMRISVTVFLAAYAFVYFILDMFIIF